MIQGPDPSGAVQWWRGWWLVPVLAVLIAFRQGPGFGLLSDAAFLIDENLWLSGPGAFWANLTHDYFWSSSGNSLPYWRPVTKGAWVIENAIGGGWPGMFHLVQIAWHLVATLALGWLARELGLPRAWALAAALWYGLHPSLIEPVSMVMARSDIACTAGMIAALASWLRWRRTGRAVWAIAHAVALVAALGSKETAVVLAPALTVVLLLDRRGSGERGAAGGGSVSPPAGAAADEGRAGVVSVSSAVGVAAEQGARSGPESGDSLPAEARNEDHVDRHRGWRRFVWIVPVWTATVFCLIGRRLVIGAGAAPGLDLDPLRWVMSGGRYLFGLFPLRIDSAIVSIPRDPGLAPLVPLTALLGWLFFGAAAVFIWRRARHALVLGALLPLSLAPVLLIHQLNVPVAASRYALADRWALPAIAGAAVVLALIVAAVNRRAVSLAVGLFTGVWVLATLVLSGRTHEPYRNTETLAALQERQYEALAEHLRTLEDRCDHAERLLHAALQQQAPAVALARAAEVPAGCPLPGRFSLLRLIALIQLRRYPEASTAAAQLDNQKLEPRYHAQAAYHAGLAHAELGDFARAESELRQASRLGHPACNLPAQLGRLLARRNQLAPAAQEYERAATCAPTDPRPLVAAASLWAAAGQSARAAALLGRVDPAALPAELRAGYEQVRRQVGGR